MPFRLRILLFVFALLLAGCGGVPRAVDKPVSTSIAAPAEAPLPTLARRLAIPVGLSAVRPMPLPQDALAARLALITQAKRSIDLQTYILADDSTGRLLVRALRDAAQRGVRVRMLLDDYYTTGLDDLLLGLAAHPGVEVRLYNPFTGARRWELARLLQLAGDFRRLNYRMHNKLLVADGAFAIAGGRNLADDYFLRSTHANFIDFELLAAGALVPDLARHFDLYWNSERVLPLAAVADSRLGPDERRAFFDLATAPVEEASPGALTPTSTAVAPLDSPGALVPAEPWPEQGNFGFFIAPAGAHADPPDKVRGSRDEPEPGTVSGHLIKLLSEARSEVIMVSPYFVPGRVGMERIRMLRSRGVELRLVTNATGSSDEPIVSIGYERHRIEMLRLGVRLYEVSNRRIQHDDALRRAFGSSAGRLHAKMGFVDRRILLAGSLNLDARSALINTEIGVGVESPELVKALLAFYRMESLVGVYELRLKPNGHSVEWVGHDAAGDELADSDPDFGWWLRFKLWFWSLIVPEDLL